MKTHQRYEGYLQIDNRNGPGFTEAEARAAGVDPKLWVGGSNVERAIVQCKHCQRGIVLNPGRVRPRNYCPKCDHYICDDCEAVRVVSGGACRTIDKTIDHFLESVVTKEQKSRGLILVGGR